MAVFLQSDGRPVFIRAYAAVFNVLRADGWPEIVKPSAFDAILRRPSASLNLQFHHGGLQFIAGCLALDTLRIWTDDFGLSFEAGPFNLCGRNAALLRSIASGELRGASWSGTVAGSGRRFEMLNGERVKAIHRFKTLDHIAVVAEGAYSEAGCWLSSEHPDDLPRRLKLLSEFWAASRPRHDTGRALRKMARGVAALPRRAAAPKAATSRPQARPGARRRVPVPMPLAAHEIYPPFAGFSSGEIAKMALEERKFWRIIRAENPGISLARARCPA